MQTDYQNLISEADKRVYAVARRTPLEQAPALSRRYHCKIWLKREDQQSVFSYKVRGAYNFISCLSEKERERPILAASAGNHAQGVALAARELGLTARIIMPKTTPDIKITATRALGADVLLHGNTYDEAQAYAIGLAREENYTLVPPYDHPLIIAGQGTVGTELLQQQAHADAVFVPVGGGGLIAGIIARLKTQRPQTKIIGVEPDEAPSLYEALRAGKPVQLDKIGIFADGAAVSKIGEETFRVARDHVDEVLLVNVDEICAAIKDIFEDTRSVAEPAGALALAGLKQYVEREAAKATDRTYTAVFSGSNVNFDRLRHIAELANLGEHQEALLAVTIPEKPGSFQGFCQTIGSRQITEFNYRYQSDDQAHVFVGIRLCHGIEEKEQILRQLHQSGYAVSDLSDNELAKMHIRHAIGGRARPTAADEKLYRFEFPERTGALLRFLTGIGDRWNITLFHYRNHGAAYGRVMAGIQLPAEQPDEFRKFLEEIKMTYWEETDNPAYRLFLSADTPPRP